MRNIIIIILLLAVSYQSIQLVKEKETHNQAKELIEIYRIYEFIQDRYTQELENELALKQQKYVTVTAYSGHAEPDKNNTAIMENPRPGMVAVSRDLFNQGWTFGKKVYITGIGVYTIGDLMNERWVERIDIFIDDYNQAKMFGIKQVQASLIER